MEIINGLKLLTVFSKKLHQMFGRVPNMLLTLLNIELTQFYIKMTHSMTEYK